MCLFIILFFCIFFLLSCSSRWRDVRQCQEISLSFLFRPHPLCASFFFIVARKINELCRSTSIWSLLSFRYISSSVSHSQASRASRVSPCWPNCSVKNPIIFVFPATFTGSIVMRRVQMNYTWHVDFFLHERAIRNGWEGAVAWVRANEKQTDTRTHEYCRS